VASEDPENRSAGGPPCADSISTLREPMKKLDDMELLVENEGTSDETTYDKYIAYPITNNPFV
jgi:hypothetical protein